MKILPQSIFSKHFENSVIQIWILQEVDIYPLIAHVHIIWQMSWTVHLFNCLFDLSDVGIGNIPILHWHIKCQACWIKFC